MGKKSNKSKKSEKTYKYSVLLGRRIKEVIEEQYNGSVREFAINCGVPTTCFYRIIYGQNYDPSIRLISRMAAYLGVGMDVFFDTPELENFDYDEEVPNRPSRNEKIKEESWEKKNDEKNPQQTL